MRRKIRKTLVSVICFMMALVEGIQPLENIVAYSAETGTGITATSSGVSKIEYVSDVAIGTKAALESAGYTVSAGGQLTSENSNTYLGYKTTSNIENAITDISVMDMYGAYAPLSYKEVLDEQKSGYDTYIKMITAGITEFRTNYKAGSEYAKLAYNTLNYLVRPAEGGVAETKFGDYLLGATLTDEDYLDITMCTSTVIASYIYNQLSLAAADDPSSNDTWLTRLSSNGPLKFYDEKGNEITDKGAIEDIYTKQYDSQYRQRASKLQYAISLFAEAYAEAKTYEAAHPGFKLQVTEDEADDAAEQATNDVVMFETEEGETETDEDLDEKNEQSKALMYLGLYDVLDERKADGTPVYAFGTKADGSARSLGEFFIEVGSAEIEGEEGDDIIRSLYPLIISQNGVTPLTAGQEAMMYVAGFDTALIYALPDATSITEAKTDVEKLGKELLESNGGKAISVWFGSNREFYKSETDGLYWTNELAKVTTAKGNYEVLTREKNVGGLTTEQAQKNYILKVGIGAASVFLVSGLTLMGGAYLAGLGAGLGGMFGALKIGVMAMAGQAVAVTTASCVACVCGAALFIVVVACIIGIIIKAILDKKQRDAEEEAKKQVTLTEIPKVIYDAGVSNNYDYTAIRYNYVPGIGSSGPVNLRDGIQYQQWVTMYYTKDYDAGEAITVVTRNDGTVDDPFIYKTNETIDGTDEYAPVHYFDMNTTAVNFNERRLSSDSSYKNVYMHRPLKNSAKNNGKYISSVTMSSSQDSQVAKSDIIKRGYKLIDVNLTGQDIGDGTKDLSSLRYYTYIGYKTTDYEESALTDIRVAHNSGADPLDGSIVYGSSSYGAAGNCNELVLFQTVCSTAGHPILAESLKTCDELSDIPEGFEAIATFGGGNAFDFYSNVSWKLETSSVDAVQASQYVYSDSSYNYKHLYVYFEPTVKYTDGPTYISGLSAVEGTVNAVPSFITMIGCTNLNENISLKYFATPAGAIDKSLDDNYGYNPKVFSTTVSKYKNTDYDRCMCISYSTTHNPYRAIYDVRYYVGEASAYGLPYNASMGSGYTSIEKYNVYKPTTKGNFNATKTKEITMGAYGRYLVATTNSIRSPYDGDYINPYLQDLYKDAPEYVENYITKYLTEFYTSSDKTPTASTEKCATLYVTGYTEGGTPLKEGDLTLSTSATYDSTTTTPVRDIRNWYSENPASLTYTGYYSIGYTVVFGWGYAMGYDIVNYKQNVYMFMNRADTSTKGKYVKSITVVNNETAEDADTKDEDKVKSGKYNASVFDAVSNGPGVLLPVELSSGFNLDSLNNGKKLLTEDIVPYYTKDTYDYWNNQHYIRNNITYYYNEGFQSYSKKIGNYVYLVPYEYDQDQAYIWVTYTDTQKDALSDIFVRTCDAKLENEKAKITVYNGYEASPCGKGFKSGDKYVYLYSVKNAGHEIMDFTISTNVMEQGYKTALSTEGKAPGYQRYFFHTKNYTKTSFTYYLKDIVYVSGSTSNEAQLKLLDLGVQSCMNFDLDPATDKVMYIAPIRETSMYETGTTTVNAISGLYLNNIFDNNTITEMIVLTDTYYMILDNMNNGAYDNIVRLFATTSQRKAHELKPKDKKYAGHYITDILIWTTSDLGELYTKGTEGITNKTTKKAIIKKNVEDYLATLDATSKAYLESYLLDAKGNVVYWDIVTNVQDKVINCNISEAADANGTTYSKIYLYARFTDDYTKATSTLAGSIFDNTDSLIIALSLAVALCCLAGGYVILKKKKKIKTAA